MAYVDANTVQDPTTGERILANWGDRVRDNQEDHEGRITTAQTDADAAAQAVTDHENASPAHAASAISYDGSDVAAALGALEADTGWILPTLEADITSGGSEHEGYRRKSDFVVLKLHLNIANSDGLKLLFTLPEGFRPGGLTRLASFNLDGSATGCPLQIETDGEVRTYLTRSSVYGVGIFLLG